MEVRKSAQKESDFCEISIKTNVRANICRKGVWRSALGKKGGKGPARGPTKGSKTREEVIARAIRISGVEGLGEVSIGRLARALRMSKSGLFVHFGSKEKLEMAVIERAYDIFNGRIFVPAGEQEISGIERVWALCDRWL